MYIKLTCSSANIVKMKKAILKSLLPIPILEHILSYTSSKLESNSSPLKHSNLVTKISKIASQCFQISTSTPHLNSTSQGIIMEFPRGHNQTGSRR